ncbi:MAG: UDP-N-acetylmuramoyl-L-alanine--D-glutamate ligase, partial [Alphaproteobacteria bacterium]|nr:UDP-N-acetylmuramoyl-L-alanine--D-glutamate ligase [Alphaproteobacteria bacterium]
MLIKDLQDKNIIIWGMGTEGIAVKEYFIKHKIGKNIYEYNDSDGNEKLEELAKISDVVIRSPGVSIYKPEFQMLKEYGIKVSSSSNIFLKEMKQRNTKVIGVSGSKGKTLSVSMMYHMMKSLGLKVALGGNIGKALIELIDEENDYIIGEFSSYQASDIKTSPNIVMFTNLFSVHSDWHKGHEAYCKDKVHLAYNADISVVNANNDELMKYTQDLPNISYYGKKDGFYAIDKELYYQGEVVCNIDDLQINGNHNMENLAGIMTVIKLLGLDWRKSLSFLPSFEQVAHRLQDIGTIDGIRFINDSISTAPEAAISAMKSFDNNMVIISGGTLNQQDYTEYAKFIDENPKVKIVITLFQCGPQIADSIRKYVKRDDFIL